MNIKRLPYELTVCKVASLSAVDLGSGLFFIGKTDDELSLVCLTCSVPAQTLAREDGWRAFCVEGPLDFSLVGILSKKSAVLADAGIGIFAVSTYDTDYVLVKEPDFECAADALVAAGYGVI